MKEKLLQFFTGKLSKSIYISIAAAVVCGAVVITSTVIVHNNNQKIDSVLESLSASESVAELSNESLTESVSDAVNTDSSAQVKAQNGEPAGDKALQYLAEYNKLTAEYKKKRAELSKEELAEPPYTKSKESVEIEKLDQGMSDEEYQQKKEELERKNAEYEARYKAECSSIAAVNEQVDKKIKQLDEQYEKDIAALKETYGIS